jgi:hypothetical protein
LGRFHILLEQRQICSSAVRYHPERVSVTGYDAPAIRNDMIVCKEVSVTGDVKGRSKGTSCTRIGRRLCRGSRVVSRRRSRMLFCPTNAPFLNCLQL